jgi:phospholipid/cholesterol/gamma-HCH transport system substrate-binding protein
MKTGGFIFLSLFLFAALLYVVGKEKKLFGGTFTVYTQFKNIAGTREGNYVRLAGINIGTVEAIELINDTTVRLRLRLDKEIQPHLKTSTLATIGSDGLMGDKLIVLRAQPDSSSTPVKNGSMLPSADPLDVDRIMNNLSKISANAETITTSLSGIVDNINKGKGSIGRMMTDDKLATKLENTVSSIKTAASNVNENMEAAKHSFLLKGYFRKKEKQRIKDSIQKAQREAGESKKE